LNWIESEQQPEENLRHLNNENLDLNWIESEQQPEDCLKLMNKRRQGEKLSGKDKDTTGTLGDDITPKNIIFTYTIKSR